VTALLDAGFEVARGVLSPQDVSVLRAAITETLERTAKALRTPYEASHPAAELEDRLERAAREDFSYAGALLHAVMADTQRDPRFEALSAHPGLRSAVERRLAPARPAEWIVRPRAVVPAFDAQRSGWHQDVTKPPEEYRGCAAVRMACWIPLSDVDEGSGALEVIPGPWKGPFPHEPARDGRFHIPDDHLPSAPRRVVPAKAGDVVLLDRYIPHRSLPTKNGRCRWAAVVWVKVEAPAP
jgi:ectoine hydroxylase-related dioxygenase (phytanoyl-CoA dioxygenase family)